MGETLRAHGQLASKSISHRLLQLKDKWKKVSDMAEARKKRLEEAVQYQQVSIAKSRFYSCLCLFVCLFVCLSKFV